MGRDSDKAHPKNGVSRRSILKGIGLGGGAYAAGALPEAVPIALNINGKDYKANVEPRATLLNTLRNQLDLTGTKLVCDRGSCGACTVHLDGKPVCSCLTLALDAQGSGLGEETLGYFTIPRTTTRVLAATSAPRCCIVPHPTKSISPN
jgi:hypothetical protein